ncbi:LOW QUALITY PROTEIN: trans-1,2-dihydrobenzene-1,2-diol dehydrogenase [Phalacrocorax carbo]|uniref:LOW QUALITY PROTEIN: trans-1,2-dihydrobenzene-1,2-diol dehydrogenase n=1 Tax=Phalacrocorax carbo TaxID=9209 RepID=UPI0031199E65
MTTRPQPCPGAGDPPRGGTPHGDPHPGAAGVAPPGPTRWGICSAGHICHDFMVALKTLPPEEHVAVAVAARDLSRAEAFARRHGLPRAYGSYRELAEDPDVEVVYVGTVNPQHLPAARLFLGAAKAVLLEKPMAVSAHQVRELVAAARAQGVFLMEGFWTRFFPAWRRLQALVAGGALGEPRLLLGSLAFPMGDQERLREPALAGGALLDLGGYGLQMATALLGGAPRCLTARGCLHPSGVDETVTMTLEYEGNRQAVLSCSMAAELPGGAALGGPLGWAEFPPSHMNCPTELVVGGRREVFPLPPPSQPLNFPHGTGLRYEAQHVRECLLQGLTESPVMPLAESELIARLLDEARRQVGAAGPEEGAAGTPCPTA